MIKKVIHVSDIHIRNILRHDEYSTQLKKFIDKVKSILEPFEKEETRIIIAGDLVHQKNTISPDLMPFVANFIRELETITKVIVIAGNHDLIVNNTEKKDTITSLFETASFNNTIFLDKLLKYKSDFYVDDNIIWALYSIYDDYRKPLFINIKSLYPDKKIVGLFHGMIQGSRLQNNTTSENGISTEIFSDCHCVMAGDVHKRQVLTYDNINIVYPGSLIQQNFGESVNNHGFAVWNMEDLTFQFENIENEYSMYNMHINNIEDIDNDSEELLNLN